MPANCSRSDSGQYAVRHNPAAYYAKIAARCKTQDVPLGATPDISARFTFVTPNLCHHYSLLRTTEEMLGLPTIANATAAASMRSSFNLG